jgi:hypothetical protein
MILRYLMVGLVLSANAAAEPDRYHIPLKERSLDLRRQANGQVRDTYIPINKRYEELKPEQAAYVRGLFQVQFGPGEEPPFPSAGLEPIYRAVVGLQNEMLVQGRVRLEVDVDEHGNPTAVRYIESFKHIAFHDRLTDIMMNATYKPALCQAKPCKMYFPYDFQLELE